MFQIISTFVTAFFIEGLSSLVSVIGISAMFGNNLIISALMVAIDFGKIIAVSALFNYWRTMPKLMLLYAMAAVLISMILTSGGAAGYLHGEFQKAIIGSQESAQKIEILKEQQTKYQQRKIQIDDQIANLPVKTSVNQRLRLMNGFKEEQKQLDLKINTIEMQLPDLQIGQIGVEAKAAPIFGIAKAFNIPIEQAINWVIGAIICVFDPLAIFLVLLGNFFIARRKNRLRSVVEPEPVVESPPVIELVVVEPEPAADPVIEPEVVEPESVVEPEPEPAADPVIEPEVVEPEPVVEPQVIKKVPKKRKKLDRVPQEILTMHTPVVPTRSSLHLIKADPETEVNADRDTHFKTSVFKDDMVSTTKP